MQVKTHHLQGKISKTSLTLILIFLASISPQLLGNDINTQILSAYEGNPESQFQLALRFSNKENIDTKGDQAFYWYKQAARQGLANAQYNLGHFYYQGIGTTKNNQETIRWWTRAAQQDYAPAQHNMGLASYEGIGMTPSTATAKKWFELCAEKLEQCQLALDRINTFPSNAKEPTAVKTNDKQTIYLKKDKQSVVLGEVKLSQQGDSFDILKTEKQWKKIRLKQPLSAWVYKSFTSIDGEIATLTGDRVRARLTPTTKENNIVTELAVNMQYVVLDEQSKWVQVALPNVVAWLVETVNPQTPSTQSDPFVNNVFYQDSYSFTDRNSDDEWLFSSTEQHYTLQLENFDDETRINAFLADNNLSNNKDTHILISKRNSIEWKYILFGNFTNANEAMLTAEANNFKYFRVEKIGNIQQQRCSAWKTTLPTPKTLEKYCLTRS